VMLFSDLCLIGRDYFVELDILAWFLSESWMHYHDHWEFRHLEIPICLSDQTKININSSVLLKCTKKALL
jgi:hypothetical protein